MADREHSPTSGADRLHPVRDAGMLGCGEPGHGGGGASERVERDGDAGARRRSHPVPVDTSRGDAGPVDVLPAPGGAAGSESERVGGEPRTRSPGWQLDGHLIVQEARWWARSLCHSQAADSDDLAQDAALEALRALLCHDPSRSNPRTWVKRRLRWWAMERRRAMARQPAWRRSVLPCLDLASLEPGPLEWLVLQELSTRSKPLRIRRERPKAKPHVPKPKAVHSCARCLLPAGIVTFSPRGNGGLAGYCKRCRCELARKIGSA